jgi:hypothetical protein
MRKNSSMIITEKAFRLLEKKVKELKNEIRAKNKIIQEYEKDWAVKLFSDIEVISSQYSVLVDPPPIEIKGTYKNQGYSFLVPVGNIVLVFSKGRTKTILMDKAIFHMGSDEKVTDIIYTEMGFSDLMDQLDRSKFHFCQINRSYYVNLRHYNLANREVLSNSISNSQFKKYSKIELSDRHMAEFISKKMTYQHIGSLQKDHFGDILKFIVNRINSFTKNNTMSKTIKPADNSANQQNANKGTSGTNKQYSKAQGNKGKQMNTKTSGNKGK